MQLRQSKKTPTNNKRVTPQNKLSPNKLINNKIRSNIKIPAKSRKGGVKTALIIFKSVSYYKITIFACNIKTR